MSLLGYTLSHGLGRVQAGENDQIWDPRSPRRNTCGVVLLHGSNNPKAYVDLGAQPASVRLAAALATAGIPCIAGDARGQSWGNPAVQAWIDTAWGVLAARYPSMRTDKIALVAGSMGGAAAAGYAQAKPGKVAALVGLIPLLDLSAFYAANVGGTQAEVAAAWGVSTGAALPAAADIAANAGKQASVPTLLGYSTVDTTVLPAWVTAYGAKVSAQLVVTDTTAGHSDAAIAGMPVATVGKFLAAHGC